ncbi:MAG: GTP pyrophosphokinase [Nitrospirae bacterium CG_4_10_14_0_8_um_filter_41_23]|nr:bifunctional (p)ppGpp synthetase/guanosine-3',5'-bis(diphosphate) 3'-pyrophosphohydrolase [Nitrospirota bacterium]OIP59325.1 MAG: GTP pyrophosphokinase [Nitrospirae bacterium CG2_30_41_42]PIQ93220.1 MAG: GTP pyrophosphokinase [Nitrospirae bacterium CG11_big_fil_rev_8_21_14_0_20_41_14]PIV41738.1 MAG: GTP pyrophosphokinase [Nitrospirae bacterium CG02_land_8_20_14_3_00_41_53]PIW86368.1 MAG: GTP pyrophosphokinase [Nitrospirae bacterium CG_4_8_14_3_um_filter_41_47]PIY86484.1 MAG: GTP pyrophospho
MTEEPITIEDLIRKVLSYNPDADVEVLRRAYHFSSEAHSSQKRVGGTPYIGHPVAVASILADMKMDVATIAAGLLHDTIEDTVTTIKDIKSLFGEEIAFLVEALTKLSKMEFMTKEEAQAENFRKMLLAMSEDVRVILIKFADRLHNMRTLRHLPENKRQRIASETIEIYAPIANRLGIGWLKIELEDLSFKIIMPDLYDELVRKVAKKREEQEGYLKEVTEIVNSKLKEEGVPGTVSWRIKHYYGIYQKMQKQKITFEEVHDVLGLRIITDTKANCYAILGLIHSLWTPIPGRFKDYIGVPKSNMYQSLHTTVIGPKGERVEFQIRTTEMNMLAEHGVASHWRYKEKGKVDEKTNRYISWLRDLIKAQRELSDAKDFLEAVKGEVVPEVLYVFTPKGEIKDMPVGSTPVDFAYSVHTQVGHRCIGAKVNDRIVPLKYTLKSGDTVEITTSPTHGPSRDWLNFVVTQRAKSRIKQWIKVEERKQSIELGIRLLEGELKRHDLSASVLKSEDMQKVLKFFSIQSLEDIYASVGHGKLSAHQVVNKFVPEKTEEEVPVTRIIRPQKEQKGITIKGVDNVLYHTAKCCFPIPGDGLVGFVTRGKGVTIHRKDCPNLDRLALDDARIVDVEWKTEGDATSSVRLWIETVDRPGILANLSALISSVNVNISHIKASSTEDKKAHITFIIEVRDKSQLSGLTQKIAQMEGVLKVSR